MLKERKKNSKKDILCEFELGSEKKALNCVLQKFNNCKKTKKSLNKVKNFN